MGTGGGCYTFNIKDSPRLLSLRFSKTLVLLVHVEIFGDFLGTLKKKGEIR